MLRRFDFDTISVATENFSVANIISGDHWDGYIYKGKLKNGQVIAVSGPTEPSYRSNQQLMEEVSILVQVEHKNLIQLLGYCIEGIVTYLIYDFAPYATLDSLLFDPDCALLGWDESGYLAPEYLVHGHRLSAKTDVYSFGVVVLEILSGRVHEHIPRINKQGLLEFVWGNWVEGTYSNIVDPRINTNVNSTVMKRVIHIGLLCIQDLPKERPTMEEVVGMLLGTSSMDLLVPKQPWNSGNLDDGEEEIYLSDDISSVADADYSNDYDDGEDLYPSEAHYSTDEEFEGR
ncbi:S-locus glycoprotein [Artemisia annua]|uniref:S-locus glycoprotein n=1 Tax=Artemisia annua TaxID=35608 RepID=A0A2U1KAY6_ARTAN|nr:S-locus glycoprotein [Artemisia annua]